MHFKKNLDLLQKIQIPHLLRIVELLRVEKPLKAVNTTQPGCPTVFCDSTGGGTALHSTRDPVREARAWVKKYDLENADGAVLAGVGLGYAAEAVLDLFPHLDPLILIEPALANFAAAMHYRDLSGILKNTRVRLILGPFALVRDALLALLDETADPARKFAVMVHPPSLAALPDSERDFREVLSYLRDTRRSAHKPFAELIEKNTYANREAMAASAGVSSLFDQFKGVPAFIAAPGPSLSKNIAMLGYAARFGIVAGLDASLIPLLREGIFPDFILSMDPQHKVEKYLPDRLPEHTKLVFFPGSYPGIVNAFPAPRRFLARPETSLDLCINNRTGDMLFASGSVFVSALDFCRRAGCNPIILTGADFAVRPDRSHVGSSPANKITLNNVDARICEGVFGTGVMSRRDYYMYLRQTELYLKSGVSGGAVWNATEGGAALSGAEPICLRDGVFRIAGRAT